MLLQDAVFPEWKGDTRSTDLEPRRAAGKDPLGTQIWKLYCCTKSRLPNQERLENLTWRMTAMNLRPREQRQAVYGANFQSSSDSRTAATDTLASAKRAQSQTAAQTSTPGGVAQRLRKPVNMFAEAEQPSDSMSIDDLMVPSSVASPAGITSPAPTGIIAQPKGAQAPGVSIASRSKPQVQIPKTMPPSSMPQSSIALHRSSEFDPVQKRVRKTSSDERGGVSLQL